MKVCLMPGDGQCMFDQPVKYLSNALGMQGTGMLMALFIGCLAGWIAQKLTRADHGLLVSTVLGITGAFFMRFVLDLLGVKVEATGWFIGNLAIASTGAGMLIVLWRILRGR